MPATTPAELTGSAIRAALRRIRGLCAGLDEVADTMRDEGIETIRVENHGALDRLLRDLNRWNWSVQAGVTQRLRDLGTFEAENSGESLKLRGRQKKRKAN